MAITKEFEAIVLDKSLRGEDFFLYTLISPTEGLCYCMKKIPSRKTAILPDFFEELFLKAEQPTSGSVFFMRDFECINKNLHLAQNYAAMMSAGEISKFIIQSANHLESTQKLYTYLKNALNAFQHKDKHDIVHIKWLYVFVKSEGFPIKEDFYSGLPPHEQEMFSTLILTPTEQVFLESELTEKLLRRLQFWINSLF